MATLTIDVVTDATAAAADLDAVAAAARGAGDAVATAGGQVQQGSVDFDALGGSADNVASKSSQAAGAMGDLAGGLSAVGATGAATALEGVALATQVAAGAGDVMNLVAETSVGRFVAQTAASIAHRTATIAGTVATGAMTAAQWALNAAMTASPLGIIIGLLALVTGAVILAYKHSETFREIVDGAMTRARQVIDAVAGAVQTVLGWFGDLPEKARSAWEAVRAAVDDKVQAAIEKVQDLVDGIGPAVSGVVSTVAGHFSSMFAPISTAIGWIDDLIAKIKSIDFPDLPGGFLGRSALPGSTGPTGKPTAGTGDAGVPRESPWLVVDLTVEGALDKDATARQIIDTLDKYARRVPEFGGLTVG